MTTASPTTPDTRRTAPVELTLTLELEPDSPTALLRTLAVLHRRRCHVTTAEYRADIDVGDHLSLRVQASSTRAHCVPAWLSALVEVRRVTCRIEASPID
jgi:hypothetical protein